jgi:putative metallohydrolase (TIGR04338 family)
MPRIAKCAPSKTAHYSFDSSTIFLPPGWAMRELVVLHELSHHITMNTTKSQAHGPEFAANYLELVSFSMSKEVSLLLRAAFDGQQIAVSERV